MCEPTTIAITSLALAGAGTYMSYKGQKESIEAQNQANEFNAKVAEQNAALAEETAKRTEGRLTTDLAKVHGEVVKTIGAQRSAYAGSGVDVGTGSAAEVTAQTKSLGDMDAITAKWNNAKEAEAYRKQNQNAIQEASLLRMGKRGTGVAGAATILSGASNIGSQYLNYNKAGIL